MLMNEIENSDDMIWRAISPTGDSFYTEYENLKRRHMRISSSYDMSTNRITVSDNIRDIKNMKEEIRKMYIFCKNSQPDTETEYFINGLRLMNSSCKTMIEDLKKYL